MATTAAAEARALRQLNNLRAMEHFAIAMTGLIALFTTIHWATFLVGRYGGRQKGKVRTGISVCWRYTQVIMNREVPWFNTVGHLTVYSTYIAINIILTFVNMDWSALPNFGRRLGWMSIPNLCLVIFLALKNTPLAFLTHHSHNALNILHRCAGYTVIIFASMHAIVMATAYGREKTLYKLSEWANVAGAVAVLSFLLMGCTATFLRRQNYELFYASHIILFLTTMVMLGYHNPGFAEKSAIVITFGSALWLADRLIRGTRMLYFSFGNFATVTPLENGGTRIVLKRIPPWATAGTHAFLWIPAVRKFETHPFSIVRTQNGGAEFVVAKQDGFTRDLYDFAVANPGGRIRASADGPYGTTPSYTDADKVILIAGGSGASHSAGVAVQLANRIDLRQAMIEFWWVIRDEAQFTWYTSELQDLKAAPNVAIRLFCTNPSSSSITYVERKSRSLSESSSDDAISPATTPANPSINTSQAEVITLYSPAHPSTPQNENQQHPIYNVYPSDIEKRSAATMNDSQPTLSSLLNNLEIEAGRPDIDAMIRRSVKEEGDERKVLICACGPDGMMRNVRESIGGILKGELRGGARVEMHLETFGW